MYSARNSFEKGVQTDVDESRKENSIVMRLENGQLISPDGEAWVITNIDGNKEGFILSDGFYPIGVTSYNGLLFFLSVNDDNISELGVYPTPHGIFNIYSGSTDNEVSYEDEYRPLWNFSTNDNPGLRAMFRTDLLGYTREKQAEIFARSSYDGSVDLFIIDGIRPNRIINTGFNAKCELTDRIYNEDDIFSYMQQIMGANKIGNFVIKDNFIQTGGSLESGNYFIFARQSTKDYNATIFFQEVGPFQINLGSGISDTRGLIDDGKSKVFTDKKLSFDMEGLDSSYPFVEIGVIRYFGTESESSYETYLINNYYVIEDGNCHVEINGLEPKIDISIDELIVEQNKRQTCETQTQIDNRFIGANWKSNDYDDDYLKEFAKRIVPKYTTNEQKFVDNQIEGHTDAEKTTNEMAYFKGEVYPFAMKVIFNDLTESKAFACCGYDDLDGNGTPDFSNTKSGLYRFPDERKEGGVNILHYKLGIKFNTTYGTNEDNNALIYYNNNIDLFKDVKGFVFLGGPRFENMLYQGIDIRTTYAVQGLDLLGGGPTINDGMFGSAYDNAIHMPLFRYSKINGWFDEGHEYYERPSYDKEEESRIFPVFKHRWDTGYSLLLGKPNYVPNKLQRYGFFSPDYMMSRDSKIRDGETLYMQKIADYSNNIKVLYNDTELNSYAPMQYHANFTPIKQCEGSVSYEKVTCHNVEEEQHNSNRYCSKARELINFYLKISDEVVPDESPDFEKKTASAFMEEGGLFFYWYKSTHNRQYWNRSIQTPKYVGIEMQDTSYAEDEYQNNLVSLYRFPNDVSYYNQLVNTYSSIKNIQYTSISQFLDFSIKEIELFKGDCFLNTFTFRQNRWFERGQWGGDQDKLSWIEQFGENHKCMYNHGIAITMTCSSALNTSIRDTEDLKMFYPYCKQEGVELMSFAVGNTDKKYKNESFTMNPGYNETTSPKVTFGYNKYLPDKNYNAENTIAYSDKYSTSAFTDGYRKIASSQYKDYESQHGPIIRVLSIGGNLLVIHHDAIFLHYISQQSQQRGADGDPILLGTAGILPEKPIIKAKFGSQHKWSIVQGEKGIYGFDMRRAILWLASIGDTTQGSQVQITNLGEVMFIQAEINRLKLKYEGIGDNPILGNGISTGFDPFTKEVLLSFIKDIEDVSNSSGGLS